MLYVSCGGDTAHGELCALLAGEFYRGFLDLADYALDDGVGLAQVVREGHEGVEGADHEGGDFEFEHFAVGGRGAGGGSLELAEGVFGG